MTNHWFKNPKVMVSVPLALILLVLVACGSAAQPEPATEPQAVPQAAAPTAVPQEAPDPAGDAMAGAGDPFSFASYWKPPTNFYGPVVYGHTLRINYEDPLEHANIWGARTGAAMRYRIPTHSALIIRDPFNAENPDTPVPDLARSWKLDEDRQGITFFLRDNVKWHNGADFTCEDARFSFETMITEEGITAAYMKSRLQDVDVNTIECQDGNALRFGFKTPVALPLDGFLNEAGRVFNKEWFLAGGEEAMFQDVSVGTGPFRWAEGQETGVDEQRFEKNPDYFIPELPYVDELVVFGILDESAQQAAMLARQTDWHWVRNFGQYDAYVAHDQIQTVIRATRSSETVWFNQRHKPFDNVRVRQAITMGIDKVTGIQVLLNGHGSMGFFMPPGSPWEVDLERACQVPGWCPPEDMEAQRVEARKILEEEGFDFDKVYTFTVESDPQRVARATFIQEQLRLLGIKTDFDLTETIKYRQMRVDGTWGDFMPSTGGVSGVDDVYGGLGQSMRCDSVSNFLTPGTPCDEKLEAMYEELAAVIDPVERKRIGDDIQIHIMEQYIHVPIYWEQEAVAWWPDVKGYVHVPSPTTGFLHAIYMWMDPANKDAGGFSGQTTGVPGGIN